MAAERARSREMRDAPAGSGVGPRAATTAVFAGGGTGGHLYPALALADALEALRPDVTAWFVGSRRGLEARVLPEQGRPHELVPIRGLDRGAGLSNWRVLPALVESLGAVRRLFMRLRPRLVVVTGGYAGAPAGIVAVLSRIPLALQEQNAFPGLTTRLLARWALQIHLAFPEAADYLPRRARRRVTDLGNPVRPPQELDPSDARGGFGLAPDAPVVLAVGGSQGAAPLNRALVDAVRGVEAGRLGRPAGLQLLWSTGPSHLAEVLEALGGVPPAWVRVLGYIEDMPRALAAAEVAVSRAGAMATSELLSWGVPMVLVPLPTAAEDHQTLNARALERAGAAVHLPESALDGERLWRTVADLVRDPEELARRRAAAGRRARPEAARRIADALAELLPPAPRSRGTGHDPGDPGEPAP